jgi:hypothetical protein
VEEEAEFVDRGFGVVPVSLLGADDYAALEVPFDNVLLALGCGGGEVDQGAYVPCDECEVTECVRAGERREHLGGGRL